MTTQKRIKQEQQNIAKIERLIARRKVTEKKADTRRKILIGAYYLELARKEGKTKELAKKMDQFLLRPNDRKLFGLDK